MADNATTPPLNMTERSTAPSGPSAGDIYLDDGSNTLLGAVGWRRYTGSAWEDIGGTGTKESARATFSGNQSLLNNTWTTVNFPAERWDTDGMHDNTTNNWRLTCKTAGRYLIMFSLTFALDSSAVGARRARIRVDDGSSIVSDAHTPNSTTGVGVSGSSIWNLAVDDYVYLEANQNSGGTLDLVDTAQSSGEFMMHRLGPLL
jgi:hypothetical protein